MPQENLGFIQFEDGLSVGVMVVPPIPDEMTRILDLYLSRESRGLVKRENNKEEEAGDEDARSHRRGWVRREQNNAKREGRDYYTGDWKKIYMSSEMQWKVDSDDLTKRSKKFSHSLPPKRVP